MKLQHGRNRQFSQIFAILTVALASLSTGMLYGWTSPSIPAIISDGSIALEAASYLTVLPPITMALSAPLFPLLLNGVGRKLAVVFLAVPQVTAWVATALASNIWWFYVARTVAGIADAGTFAVLPVYVGEIAEPSVRGSWGNMLSISIVLGKFLVNAIGSYTSVSTAAWICASFSFAYAVLVIFLPESPYFLLAKGKDDKAKNALRKLRWRDDVDTELEILKGDVIRQTSEKGTFGDLFKIRSNRRALIICLGLRATHGLSGIMAFDTYSQYMFQHTGGIFNDKTAAIIYMVIAVPFISLSTLTADKFGRRSLAIFSSVGCAIVLTIESAYLCLKQFSQVDLEYLSWLPLVGMVGFHAISCLGLLFLPTLIATEMLSMSIKEKAVIILVVNHALWALIVPKVFQLLTYNFGVHVTFLFFTCCSYLVVIFVYIYVIETKNKTLEEIQQCLKRNTM